MFNKLRKLTFFFLLATAVFAEKIKYKDVFAMIQAGQVEQAYPLLKLLLKSDTSMPNANLQVALYCLNKAKSFDVLKQNQGMVNFSDTAVLYFNKASKAINEKEIRRNDQYYLLYKNTPTPIDNRDSILKRIQNDINVKKRELINYQTKTKKIYFLFNKGVAAYNTAAQKFQELNNLYVNSKNLCLYSDSKTISDLLKIQSSFDSSIFYVNAYKKSIKEFPIQGYNQSYEEKLIETFRVDGLSNASFLSDKIMLWNYSEWTKSMLAAINTDIKKIREQILIEDLKYKKMIDYFQSGKAVADTMLKLKPDLKLQKLVSKYDFNAVVLKIGKYNQLKNDLLGNMLHSLANLDQTNIGNIEAKMEHLSKIKQSILNCDTVLDQINKYKIAVEVPKYREYFAKTFQDSTGFKDYLAVEKTFINNSKSVYEAKQIQLMYQQTEKFNDSTVYFSSNAVQIPYFKHAGISKSAAQTLSIKEDKKGNQYLAGSIGAMAFVAKINDKRQVLWLKQFPTRNAGSLEEFISAVEPLDEGCAVVFNSRMANELKSLIIRMDKAGNEINAHPIFTKLIARKMIFDELNDALIIIFKGSSADDYLDMEESALIAYYDATGVQKWSQNFTLKGAVSDIVKISDGYLLALNYATFSTAASKLQSSAGSSIEKSAVLLLKFNSNGEIKASQNLGTSLPVYATGIVKQSNNKIYIVCLEEDYVKEQGIKKSNFQSKRLQYIVNSNLEGIY